MDFASNIEAAFREIFETMVGVDSHGLGQANMVAAGIKFRCPAQGQEIELSIPSVVWGKGYSCETTGRFEFTPQTFGLEAGPLVVGLQAKVSNQDAVPLGTAS